MLEYLQTLYYFFKFDFKYGYHHIKILQKYLGFCWEGELYVYLVLPFCLSSAPYIFTKIIKCILKHLRLLGVKIAYFIDDDMMTAKKYVTAGQHSKLVHKTLKSSGFVVNEEKSVCSPKKEKKLDWLCYKFWTRQIIHSWR